MRTLLLVLSVALLTHANAMSQVATTGSNAREEFTAIAISPGGPRASAVAANLEIVIERWSTPEERQRLLDALTRGQNAALEVMRDFPRVGYIRVPPNLAWDLHYSHQSVEDGERHIFLGTDRPVSFAEEVLRPRTINYPFTFVDIRLNREGDGEGTLSRATRVTASNDGRFVHLETWDTQPVKLTEVKPR